MTDDKTQETQMEETLCAECGVQLAEGQAREVTDSGVFCPTCYARLVSKVKQLVARQSQDINYPTAALGGLLGGVLGILVWWGFTVVTSISFGLVAVAIGFAVGKGVVMFSGGKRSMGLQGVSIAISTLSFAYASYLVNRTFILRAVEDQGVNLPWVPDLSLWMEVISLNFGIMDVFFLAFVVYQAWKITAPIRIHP